VPLRLTWRPKHWHHDSTVQVMQGVGRQGALRFHQEWLVDAGKRSE
jgi:hypothetical protein